MKVIFYRNISLDDILYNCIMDLMSIKTFSNEIKVSWLKYNQIIQGDRVQERLSLGHHVDCLEEARETFKLLSMRATIQVMLIQVCTQVK